MKLTSRKEEVRWASHSSTNLLTKGRNAVTRSSAPRIEVLPVQVTIQKKRAMGPKPCTGDRIRLVMADASWMGESSHRLKANLFHNQTQSQNGLWTKRGVRGHCARGAAREPRRSRCTPPHFCTMNAHGCV